MSTRGSTDELIGAQLGSCVLERPLGAGGMGIVYLARQERPRRQVAVKVLRPRPGTESRTWPAFLARFRREADAAAALDHSNIVPIYHYGEQDGVAYLIMPYLPGGSLAALLAREGPLPLDHALNYLEQAAAALDYAHAQGIIHRDVKPSNLLLHPDGRLLLADFGIASLLVHDHGSPGPSTRPRNEPLLGTPNYIAPEQIRGERVSPATDIYALGALAYTLLASQPPFGDGTSTDILHRQLAGRPRSLRALHPELSVRVEETIFVALAERPDDRPTSAGAFVRSLRESSRGRTLASFLRSPMSARGAPGERRSLPGTLSLGSSYTPAPVGTEDDIFAHDDPTLFGSQDHRPVSNAPDRSTPVWPSRTSDDERLLSGSRLSRTAILMAAAAGLLGLALLLGGLVVGLPLMQPSPPASQSPGLTQGHLATPTLAPTPTVTPTPTPPANWLSVSPASIQLGCTRRTKSARVVLQNNGTESLSWRANVTFLGGVSVNPSSGTLHRGDSASITVTNTSNFVSHHDAITFEPSKDEAGAPASVAYSTEPCLR